MLKVRYTNQLKKDYKLIKKRGYDINKLKFVTISIWIKILDKLFNFKITKKEQYTKLLLLFIFFFIIC